MQVRSAVIPAAGLGTRFLPATKAVPKELFPIGDQPAIQVVIDEALGAGIDHIVFSDGATTWRDITTTERGDDTLIEYGTSGDSILVENATAGDVWGGFDFY